MEPRRLPAEVVANDKLIAVHVGMDIGMSYDYTAVCVAQVRERKRRTSDTRAQSPIRTHERLYRVEYIRRWPHNMAAPEIAGLLVKLLTGVRAQLVAEYERAQVNGFTAPSSLPWRAVYVDATGLGKAVVPSLQQVCGDFRETRDAWICPVSITHGDKPYDERSGSVGKTRLIANLQALLAAGCVDLPASDPESPTLRREIAAYRFSIDRDGKESFGAATASTHDDLVTALALATLVDPQQYGVSYGTVHY